MLHSNLPNDRTRALLDSARLQGSADGGIAQIIEAAFGFVKRRYKIILLMTVLATTGSLAYLRITPPTYTGQVTVLFGNPKSQALQQQSVLAEIPIDNSQIETQMQMLRSKAIATTVIDKLQLSDDPDFKAPERRLGARLRAIRAWLGLPAPEAPTDQEAEPKDHQNDEPVTAFLARLSSSRLGYSNMIEISFNASNPIKAAEIANAVAKAYIADQIGAKYEANRVATNWLRERLNELGQQALSAERAVDEYKSKNNIVAASGKLMDDQQVSEINSRLVAARAQTAETLARYRQLQSIVDENSASSMAIGNLDATGSDALSNPIINSLRSQYLENARREADWSVRFGKDHMAVIELRTKMKGLRASILDEARRLAETSRSELGVAKQRQEAIEKQLATAISQSRSTNSAEVTMRELETNAKEYRNLHEVFLQRYMGSVQQESFPIAEARIVSPASPPHSKSKPKSLLILAMGLFGGIAFGTALGVFRDLMDRAFRTTAQIEAALKLPCLSLVPLLRTPKWNAPAIRQTAVKTTALFDQRTIARNSGIYWAASAAPLSRFAESIRAIRLAIDHNPTKTSNKVIGITSALPNEGKSTIAASLAQLIAYGGKRVIVVDCDLRNPSLSANLTPNAGLGIVDILSGSKTLEDAVWIDPKTKMAVLPAASNLPIHQSSELLMADRTRTLFDQLRATYDYVIVDLPPLAPIIDARATTQLVDTFVLVVEWGRTNISVIQQALRDSPNVHETLLGTILNKTDMNAMKRYQSYHSDYYCNENYTRYGHAAGE
ncbi:polysaccharide biosynthesis tyrosine autokinase [Bradyrhizobium genosp. L]|uniref:polysaccharide biosynthesis tyrosine autokinase n=1 Tax=Bradyrhizobium genosp. L TaxID=83637 RepID=UPI0018A31E25|nr:polysaccharide biosynthesis tyrosine autokinase [Bradyrhizobium genosp. L]QPF86532.1 polysaccharide biosynthesis tyrosine autokinase [Bradyrhizobium genosp. L]